MDLIKSINSALQIELVIHYPDETDWIHEFGLCVSTYKSDWANQLSAPVQIHVWVTRFKGR